MNAAQIPIAGGLLLLLGGLAFVGHHKARAVWSTRSSLARVLDRSQRRVGAISLVPAVVLTIWLLVKGTDPPAALVVGCAAGLGLFSAALGFLRMEGMLFEPESAMLARRVLRKAPSTSPRGRVIAVSIGIVLLGVALYALSAVQHESWQARPARDRGAWP